MKKALVFVVGVLLVLGASAVGIPDHHKFSPAMEHLLNCDQEALDAIYSGATAGSIPDGTGYGMALIEPKEYFLNEELMKLAEKIWQGKDFHRVNESYAWLENSVFGYDVIKAEVSPGMSWFDGKTSIILDYSKDNHDIFGFIRDEIREFGTNMYVGRVYLFLKSKPFVLNFALEFDP